MKKSKSVPHSMEFALYVIPDGKLYQMVTDLLGYDIRLKKTLILPTDEFMRQARAQNQLAAAYGAHMTITDVVTADSETIDDVIKRTRRITKHPLFRSIQLTLSNIDAMPNAQNVIALQFKSNWRLTLLHILLTLHVQTLGSSSKYKDQSHTFSRLRWFKARYLLSPYCLNDFIPHITVLAQAREPDIKNVIHIFSGVRTDFALSISHIAIVQRRTVSQKFTISRTFPIGKS